VPRTSRARWLAFGSTLALLGCTANVASVAPTPDGGASNDTSIVGCATRTGYFSCDGNVCDRSIQACWQGSCEWYGELSIDGIDTGASCGPCPTCSCLQTTLGSSCQCTEDAEGDVTISCGGCYGAPPTRLERLS